MITGRDALEAFRAEVAVALEKAPAESLEADQPPPTSEQADHRPMEENAALERALRERHGEEAGKMRLRQQAEYEQTARILEAESREKLGHFDALQQAARERFLREADRARIGFIETIKAKLDPRQAAEDARQRQERRTPSCAGRKKNANSGSQDLV